MCFDGSVRTTIKTGNPRSFKEQCQIKSELIQLIDEAIESYRQSLTLNPDYLVWQSNLLFCLNNSSTMTAEAGFEEHARWGRRFASWDKSAQTSELTDPANDRPICVGYVSPDFRKHSVGYFIEPLIANHDRNAVKVFCYAEVSRPDVVTTRLRGDADSWISTVGLSDAAVAEKIRADKIDILVDLAGHSKNHRLSVFAMRPAPVQATWLGYPNTTGLSMMDFRIIDEISDPASVANPLMTETPIRLPQGFLCYRPDSGAPDIAAPPCRSTGFITFGSFNNLAKISPLVISLWAKILHRVAGSRLLIKCKSLKDQCVRDRLHQAFADLGIKPERLDFLSWSPSTSEHLALYGKIDIALDTFPYNGTTTTCEALWMGVPVVTLSGDRHAARVGASLLSQIGLTECVAHDSAHYENIACDLAGDVGRLMQLRQSFRDKMRSSSLMDEAGFARQMEAAFRTMIDLKRESAKP